MKLKDAARAEHANTLCQSGEVSATTLPERSLSTFASKVDGDRFGVAEIFELAIRLTDGQT